VVNALQQPGASHIEAVNDFSQPFLHDSPLIRCGR
jgi:hypothetical protein